MQARFYLPMWGRFASPDPAYDQHFEMTQSWNIYSYVQNNPITHTDPTGMFDPSYSSSLGSRRPDIFIVHDTAGLLSRGGFDGMKSRRETAGHVYINTDGKIWENKSLSQNGTATRAEWPSAAFEKKIDTNRTVNVELNAAKENPTITKDQYSSLAQVAVTVLAGTEGPLTITPHKEIDRGIKGAHGDVRNFDVGEFSKELMQQCVAAGINIGRIQLAPTEAWTRSNQAGAKRETPPERKKEDEKK